MRGYGKLQNVREKSGKSQGILKWVISGNPVGVGIEVALTLAAVLSLANCLSLYVISKALSGELSCTGTGLVVHGFLLYSEILIC